MPRDVAPPRRSRLRGRKVHLHGPLALGAGEILLSFDDGPDPVVTPAVLRTLQRFDVGAVFFCIGDAVVAHPALPGLAQRRGHVVGSHTMTHPHMAELAADAARREVVDGHAALQSALGGKAPPYFRFPFLETTDGLDRMVAGLGLIAIGVDIVPRDWACRDAAELLGNTRALLDTTDRGILLLHDIHRHTAEALPMILRELMRRGFKVVTPVSD